MCLSNCCNCQPKSNCPEEGRKEGRLCTLTARRSCTSKTLKVFENLLTYWITFTLKARRLLPALAGTFIPFGGSSRQLAAYTLWTVLINSDLSGHEESCCYCPQLAMVVPLPNRETDCTQSAWCRTGDHSCKPVFLCNCRVTGSRDAGYYCISAEWCQLFTLLQQKQDHL